MGGLTDGRAIVAVNAALNDNHITAAPKCDSGRNALVTEMTCDFVQTHGKIRYYLWCRFVLLLVTRRDT